MNTIISATALLAFTFTTSLMVQAESLPTVPATLSDGALTATMLAADGAGQQHMVAVGDHGVILISDDGGIEFHQATNVPVSVPLTGVSFVDERHGWAVGHWGTILVSDDGGDNWTLQRVDSEEDRPLFAVHFFDSQQGVAVGLWSLVLTTENGGKSWQQQQIQAPPGARRADLNLMGLFADGRGTVFAVGERGQVLRSADAGKSWSYLDTGYDGTLWAGAVLADGSLLVGGQRGTLLHGSADGSEWKQIQLQSRSSITGITTHGQDVLVVGLDGLAVVSRDGGRSFQEEMRAQGTSLTSALLGRDSREVLFTRRGVLALSGE